MADILFRGNIVHAPRFGELQCIEHGYIAVAQNGLVEGVFSDIPDRFADWQVCDLGELIITQAFCDMHFHAPQYTLLGLGMDMQLLDWLQHYTFPEEARFADADFAARIYSRLADELVAGGTTRGAVFSSLHTDTTLLLCQILESKGFSGFVGKVNMDRNSPDYIRETAAQSLADTERFVAQCSLSERIKPIITPRFTPACSDELMRGLGALAAKHGLRVQSHLSENMDEIKWVQQLCPDAKGYWHTYERFGLFGEGALMGHCVYSDDEERRMMAKNGVWAIHCPYSNVDIASGIMHTRRFIDEGIHVALGSDIAGGASLFMPHVIAAAIRSSKLNWLKTVKKEPFLTVAEGFYLATSAPAAYFGDAAGFAVGNPFQAIVVDDSRFAPEGQGERRSLEERFERMIYRMEPCDIKQVFCGRV